GQCLGLGLVDRRLRLLDEREHVAHAEDTRSQTIGMERLERVGLLTHADEGDGAAGHVPDGQRGAAARIAVHLGEHDRVDADRLVELVGDGDRVLTGHRIHDEEHVVGRDLTANRLQLGQERLVDMAPARNAASIWSRPAVSRMSGVRPRLAASSRAVRQISSGVWPWVPVTGTPSWAPSVRSWSMAAGRWGAAAGRSG